MTTIVLAPTLDSLILEYEDKSHVDGGVCEFNLGRGNPLTKIRCPMCIRLSALIDVTSSWTQRIDTGRLIGRSVEIVPISSIARNIRDAENAWKFYKECDDSQRAIRQCFLRRYYASFTCNGSHYTIRDVTHRQSPPPLDIMIEQLLELFTTPNSLPVGFIHGNPTRSSISFSAKLPVALRHKGRNSSTGYFSRYLLQVDYGGVESAVISNAAALATTATGSAFRSILISDDSKTLTIRRDSSFLEFLREYPRYSASVAFQMLLRGLLSFYPTGSRGDTEGISQAMATGPSSSTTLREAFEDLKGFSFPCLVGTVMA